MSKPYSIMFVGGGRRLELAQLFEKIGIAVIGYECEKHTPLSAYFPVIKGLKWQDKDVLNHILEIKDKYKINWLLPLQDEATFVLSKLDGCVVSSSANTNELCWDKSKFMDFCKENFADNYPWPYDYPYIFKPRYGFGSKNITIVYNFESENSFYTLNGLNNFIKQKYIKGQEWTVDSYINRAGKCLGCVPRKRLRVSGGEILDGETCKNSYLEELTRRIVVLLDIRGPCCVQFIEEESTGKIYIMECNARFGGGAPLSIFAGFNMVDMIYKEYFLNKEIKSEDYIWRDKTLMRRTFQSSYFFC